MSASSRHSRLSRPSSFSWTLYYHQQPTTPLASFVKPLFVEPIGGGVCRPWYQTTVDVGHSLVTLRSLKTPDFE